MEPRVMVPYLGCSWLLFHLKGDLYPCPYCISRVRCLIDDGISMDVCQDAWISSFPLSRWSTFVNMDMNSHLRVCNLSIVDGKSWRIPEITHLFGSQLANRILAIPIPTHRNLDLRVWGLSCPLRFLLGTSSRCVGQHQPGRLRLLGFGDCLSITRSYSFFERLHGINCLLALFLGIDVWSFCQTIRFVEWRVSRLSKPYSIARGHV